MTFPKNWLGVAVGLSLLMIVWAVPGASVAEDASASSNVSQKEEAQTPGAKAATDQAPLPPQDGGQHDAPSPEDLAAQLVAARERIQALEDENAFLDEQFSKLFDEWAECNGSKDRELEELRADRDRLLKRLQYCECNEPRDL